MANFIELTSGQGPRAINIDHIASFSGNDQGTRITFRGTGMQEDVRESYEVVRSMLSVTPAPQAAAVDIAGITGNGAELNEGTRVRE